MNHPVESELALFAGGDLGFLRSWRMRRHMGVCDRCRREVSAFADGASALRHESEALPPHLNWDRMAAEMTANIHVGLEAGECVGPVRNRLRHTVTTPSPAWRAVAIMAAMTVILLAAWALNPAPRRVALQLAGQGVELRNTATGLELNENGNALVLLHGRGLSTQRTIIVSAPGALKARFVDEETDQMTITHVYAE